MPDALPETPQASIVPARRSWKLPTVAELPKLTALTLASAIGGGGGTGGGGSTVFGLLLAVGLLASGCSADQTTEPSAPAMPKAVAMISCSGDVTKLKLSCGSPQAAPGQEILGGQGVEIALRSSNININGFGEFEVDVSLQNLSTQRIGWTGTTPTGEEVFFVSDPLVDVGTISVAHASQATFTAPNQKYYQYIGMLQPMQTSAPVLWTFHLSGGVQNFTFTVMVAADVFDQGGVLQWRPVDGTTQRWFHDVAASSATDRMAVGNSGLTAHYTGGKWVALPAVTTEHFNAVTAVAPGEYYAVTGSGAVFHFKNRVWTELYHRADYFAFNAIWVKDTSLIVAVGQAGAISRYASGSWADVDVGTAAGGDFVAVSGSSDGSLISAVNGSYLNSEVWTSVGGAAFGLDPNFGPYPMAGVGLDIAYDASGNALLAYADFGGPTTGLVLSSTGDVLFSDITSIPTALIPHGTDKVAVAMTTGGDWVVTDLDYSSLPATPTSLTGPTLSSVDIAQLTATDAGFTHFDIVSGGSGRLLSWDGATWTDDQGDGDWMDPDLWGIGDTIFALDGIGGFHKIVNGVMTNLSSGGAFHRLWGVSSTEFWTINATEAWHFDPVNGWTNEHTVPNGSDNRDVWVDPTGTSVIVLGENGEISSRISGVWTDQSIPRNVNAVWGCDSHNAWIVTGNGEIWKWVDGVVSLDTATGPQPLRAINGNQFCDPWVAGDNGTMWHRFGGVWINRFDPSAAGWTLRAVAIRGANQTIAAGDNGYAGLFSDAAQVQSTPLPTQGDGIQALWRLDNGEVYAGGDQVLLRGYR